MQGYFPYSFIINLSPEITVSITKRPFFGEWAVCGTDSNNQSQNNGCEISELYY